jgi:hypothetical protein
VKPGLLYVSAVRTSGPVSLVPGASGTLAVLDLVALPGARPGAQPLNLLAGTYGGGEPRVTELNDSGLTLNPAPTNGANDPVDGSVIVLGPKAPAPSPASARRATDAAIESAWGTPAATPADPTAVALRRARTAPPARVVTGASTPRPVARKAAVAQARVVLDKLRREPDGG